MRLIINTFENIPGKNYLKKQQWFKKKKIEISSQFRINNFSDIQLNNKQTTYYQKTELHSKYFNSFRNLNKFNGFVDSLNFLNNKEFLVQKILYDCYPSEQALVKLSVNKLEELGSFFFSLIVLQQNKLYYEFESPKKLPFPLIILTNISVLKKSDPDSKFLSIIQKNQKNFSIKTITKKEEYKNSIFQTFYQAFFFENLIPEIFEMYGKIKKETFFKKNNIFLYRFIFLSICSIKVLNKFNLKNILFTNTCIFEFPKIVKKTISIKYGEVQKDFQTPELLKKSLPIRLKFNISDKQSFFSKSCSYDFFIFSKNIKEIFNQVQIMNKLSCSIIVSSSCIPKINQILVGLNLNKLVIKVFQIENMARLDFQKLIEVLSDLKNENQRLIFMIGTPTDISCFNFIFSVLILPKIHCFKLLSGVKTFQEKKTKIFFIKKSSEKCLFLFPIIKFHQLKDFYTFSDTKTSRLCIDFEFQKNISKRFFGINSTINTKNNIIFNIPEDSVSTFSQINKILIQTNQNKFLCFIFLNLICMISKEKYITPRSPKEGKLKKIIFFLFILSSKVL